MVTMQLLCVNGRTGEVRCANAGHPFPVLISEGLAAEVSLPSRPLGAFRRIQPSETELCLHSGESLILATDGFIEAKDQSGEMVGYDRYRNMLVESRCPDPDRHFQAFRKAHLLLAPVLEDDASMVIISCDGFQTVENRL